MFITFLTDFGLEDDFVGTCHGVMKRIAPDAQIIDITHGIRPGRILQGALVLANTLAYMPAGVHLAVVDPGVGGSRRPLVLQDGEGRLYVGPDNGLLLPAVDRFGGVAAAHELANPAYALERVSRTFHGRDLFSPAAAHLAAGVADRGARTADRPRGARAPRRAGAGDRRHADPRDRARSRPLRQRVAQRDARAARGGRSRSRLRASSSAATATAGSRSPHARSADARAGELILYEDSYRNVAVAVSSGSAAELLGVDEGSDVTITPQ